VSKDPKKIVSEIVKLVGKSRAEKLLIMADASTSVAGKLVRGRYPNEVGDLLAGAIRRAREMAEAEKAS
jgi:hypothetical protein